MFKQRLRKKCLPFEIFRMEFGTIIKAPYYSKLGAPLMISTTISDPRLPDTWNERYRDLQKIGIGGYAHVSTARRVSDDQLVVIQTLREKPLKANIVPKIHGALT